MLPTSPAAGAIRPECETRIRGLNPRALDRMPARIHAGQINRRRFVNLAAAGLLGGGLALLNAGVMQPNALQYNLVSARNDFAARRFAFRFDGFQSASVTFWDNAPNLDPPGKPRIMTPFPAVDGGTPT